MKRTQNIQKRMNFSMTLSNSFSRIVKLRRKAQFCLDEQSRNYSIHAKYNFCNGIVKRKSMNYKTLVLRDICFSLCLLYTTFNPLMECKLSCENYYFFSVDCIYISLFFQIFPLPILMHIVIIKFSFFVIFTQLMFKVVLNNVYRI